MLTPVSEDSSVEMVTLSPPQISPFSQLSETASDISAPEVTEVTEVTKVISLSIESGSLSDSSPANGEPHADDNNEPKKSKAHLHCPVCKVTMNSVSQLDAHNSGMSVTRHTHFFFFLEAKCFQKVNSGLGAIRCAENKSCQLCALCTRHKAQADAGRSRRPASTPGESGGSSRGLQEQAARQQRQRRRAQQELPV